MMIKSNINGLPDRAFLALLGDFVRQNRLVQNKTQDQVSREAGINRTTLIELERGENSTTLTFIQILRVLDLLYMLEPFQVTPQISPLQLVKLERKTRKRASRQKNGKRNSSEQP